MYTNLLLRYSGASPNRSSAQQTDFFRFFRWIPLPLQMEPLKSSCITWFISGVICDEIITCCALYTIKLDVLMLHTSQHQRYRTVFTTGLRERLGYKCAATSLWLLHISRCCDEFWVKCHQVSWLPITIQVFPKDILLCLRFHNNLYRQRHVRL